jgi:hypothetical protein
MLQKGYKKLDLRRKWMYEYVLNPEIKNNSYNNSERCKYL